LKTPKGTRDLLPADTALFQAIEQRAMSHFARYGFKEIRTPIFEDTALFARGIGEGTDIVNKEMYTFEDKGGRSITLRPEMTASVCRSVIQHNLVTAGDVTKLMYTGPMFRYERAQAGRYRQFYQFGVEVFGSDDPLIDVETIASLMKFIEPFELPNLTLAINSVGDETDRPQFTAYLKETLTAQKDKLCNDCHVRIEKNVLRVLDCKVPTCKEVVADLKPISDFLNDDNRAHFDAVRKGLDDLGIPYEINHLLVRGLDYYTKTAFELLSGDLGAQSAVMGGGRYDNLISMLGGKATPGFGWALGMDRLASIIAQHQEIKPASPDIFFVYGDRTWLEGDFPWLQTLRDQGLYVSYDYRTGSFKSQMKRANKEGARFVAIVGESEREQGTVAVKDMVTSDQVTVGRDQLIAHIKEV
jgi:histidyl-tRNA synthetase